MRSSTSARAAAHPCIPQRIATVGLGVGVAVLLLLEATDAIQSLRRRSSRHLANRWAGIERREQTEARRAVFGEVAALTARITQRRGRPQTEPDVTRPAR